MKVRKLLWNKQVFIGLIVVAIAGVTFYSAWRDQKQVDSVKIPAEVSKSVLFTPYTPSKLPSGYSVDADSFSVHEDAFLFTATSDKSKQLVFSEQAMPKNFDIDAFYKNTIANAERLTSAVGTVVFGRAIGQPGNIVSVATKDNTWLIITGLGGIEKSEAQLIVDGLITQN